MELTIFIKLCFAREGVELAIFMALCLCQRSGETGYIHGSLFVPEKWRNWLYSWIFVCAREGVELAIFIKLCVCAREVVKLVIFIALSLCQRSGEKASHPDRPVF